MKFQDFIENGKVRRGLPDIQKAKALVKMSGNHIKVFKDIEINETSACTIMVMHYEALREIIEAICLKEGLKVYSHEAFTHFLKEKSEEIISIKFDKFRILRNLINYYGEGISIDESIATKRDILEIIEKLKNKYLLNI